MSDLLSRSKQEEFAKLYNSLSLEERQELGKLLSNPDKFQKDYDDLQNLFFKKRPPTGKEFLDWRNGYIPRQISESLFPNVIEEFCFIVDPANSHINDICLMGSIRRGKSVELRLLIVYMIVYFHCMRNIYDFIQNPTPPVIYLLSYYAGKSKTLMLKPIFDLMAGAPRFKRVHSQAKVIAEQEKYGTEKIVWSSATSDQGEITLTSGLQIRTGSGDFLNIIGADLFFLGLTEYMFFIRSSGATEEDIYQLYTDGEARIAATFPSRPHLSAIFIDSSPNNADSPIERYIYNDLRYQETTYFRDGKQWDVAPEKRAPIWSKTGETFKIITGNGKYPMTLDPTDAELVGVPLDLIEDVPVDYHKAFEKNLKKSINDILGKPSTAEGKFIQNGQLIDRIFDDNLTNIPGAIIIDAKEEPKNLIWEKIKDIFFTQYDGVNYSIKRAPSETRWIGLDNAFSHQGDILGFTMGHYEWSRDKNTRLWVNDMSFGFSPGKEGINQDALRYFILDLVNLGGISLSMVFLDTYESGSMQQFFKRYTIPYMIQSIDRNAEGYDHVLEQLLNDTIRSGKNIFLKNNLICLEDRTSEKNKKKIRKIDHPKGPTNNVYNGSWDSSDCGYFAKDVSDSLAQAVFGAHQTEDQYQPVAIYEDENSKAIKRKESVITIQQSAIDQDEAMVFYKRLSAYQVPQRLM